MARFKIFNGPMPTTAAQAKVSVSTIKTMLQLKPFNTGKIIAWGFSLDGYAAAAPGTVELLDTGTVFGTVTASADADCTKTGSVEDAVASVAGLTLGTSATGYTCTSEGSITSVRMFDAVLAPPTAPYVYQFPLGQEPKMIIGNAVRIRATFGTSVGMLCWVEVEF